MRCHLKPNLGEWLCLSPPLLENQELSQTVRNLMPPLSDGEFCIGELRFDQNGGLGLIPGMFWLCDIRKSLHFSMPSSAHLENGYNDKSP